MIKSIERRRRPSVHDEWPSCDFCCIEFSAGFTFYLESDQHCVETLHVCDGCLSRVKTAPTGWLKYEEDETQEE